MFVLKKTYKKLSEQYEKLKLVTDEAIKQRDILRQENENQKHKIMVLKSESDAIIKMMLELRNENAYLHERVKFYELGQQ
jgi:hypothetical protein